MVFTGHFHKRQHMQNVTYMGNAFPHNYADAWDDDRGMMILEWGGQPKYINWPDMPRYITIKISQLLEDPEKYLKPKMYVRVTLDIKISYEEANFIRETFIDKYKTLENEIKMLQEDKKHLIEDLKENHGISPKVIRKAIQVAKIRTSLGDEITQLDNIVEQLEGSIV